MRGFEISQKTPPPLILGNIDPTVLSRDTLNPQLKQTFQTYFDPSQDVFGTPSPWQTYFKTPFLKKYLRNRDIEQNVSIKSAGP